MTKTWEPRPRPIRPARRWTLAVALLALTPLLAACGDDDDGATSTTAPAGSDAPASDDGTSEEALDPANPVSITIGATSAGMAPLDFHIAQLAGFMEEEGLAPNLAGYISNSQQIALGAVSGDFDIVATGTAGYFAARAADRDALAIAGGADVAWQIVLSADAAERLAEQGITPDSPIEDRITALRGFTIATTALGGNVELWTRAVLEHYGVDPNNDVTFIGVGDAAALVAGVREGAIEAMVSTLPMALVPVQEGIAVLLVDATEGELEVGGGYSILHVTSQRFADENPAVVAAYTRAIERARQLIVNDPAEASRLYAELQPELDPALRDAAVEVMARAFEAIGTSEIDPETFDLVREGYNDGADASGQTDVTFEEGVWQP